MAPVAPALLAASPGILGVWDTSSFAIFRSNQPDAFATPEMHREAAQGDRGGPDLRGVLENPKLRIVFTRE